MSQAPERMSATPLPRPTARTAWLGRVPVIDVGLALVCVFLLFYNLEHNPQILPDEGSLLALARTLAEDGLYAIRTAEGHQTYGIIQSIGPTVVVPVALSFKLFGVGLAQARVVASAYALLALLGLYLFGAQLFGRRAALLAVLLTLGAPAITFLILGRSLNGEIPALAFFLFGCWLWLKVTLDGRPRLAPLAGLCFGLAAVTKNYYLVYTAGALALVTALDLLVYRQRLLRPVIVAGLVTALCWAAWAAWQVLYYGLPTFQANAANLRELAAGTFQISPSMTRHQLRLIFGDEGGYFFFYWGPAALAYGAWLAFHAGRRGPAIAFALGFTVGGFVYYLLVYPPWLFYIPGLFIIAALFTGTLWSDLIGAVEQAQPPAEAGPRGRPPLAWALWAAILLGIAHPLYLGVNDQFLRPQPHTGTATEAAAFLEEHVDKRLVVETWERMMGFLTDHRFHYPDHGLGGKVNAYLYRGGPHDFALGAEYFKAHQIAYLVWGVAATETRVYDQDYLAAHACVVARFDRFGQHIHVYRINDRPVEPGAPPCLEPSAGDAVSPSP